VEGGDFAVDPSLLVSQVLTRPVRVAGEKVEFSGSAGKLAKLKGVTIGLIHGKAFLSVKVFTADLLPLPCHFAVLFGKELVSLRLVTIGHKLQHFGRTRP
jgi:hypothetical protein